MNTFSENGNDFVGRLLHEGGVSRRTFSAFPQTQKASTGSAGRSAEENQEQRSVPCISRQCHQIEFDSDAQDKLGRNGLDTSRDLAHLIHTLVDEGAKFLVDSCAPLSPLRRGQSFLDRFGGGEKLQIVCQRVLRT